MKRKKPAGECLDSRVYRLYVLSGKQLQEGSWYDCWTCTECGQILAAAEIPGRAGPGVAARLLPQDIHALIRCPDCGVERMHGINERTVRQHPRSLTV